MTKAQALADFLEQATERDHGWGVEDCNLMPANWVMRIMDRDPASGWRGRYRSLAGAARLVRAAGGLEALWLTVAGQIGLRETRRCIIGDVGLVRTPCALGTPPILDGLVGAICLGRGEWAVKSTTGLSMARRPVVKAWRVEWPTR